MQYIICHYKNGDMFNKEFDSAEEAIKHADIQWSKMADYDKKRATAYYVLKSVNADVEAENHFDGDIIKEYK